MWVFEPINSYMYEISYVYKMFVVWEYYRRYDFVKVRENLYREEKKRVEGSGSTKAA